MPPLFNSDNDLITQVYIQVTNFKQKNFLDHDLFSSYSHTNNDIYTFFYSLVLFDEKKI